MERRPSLLVTRQATRTSLKLTNKSLAWRPCDLAGRFPVLRGMRGRELELVAVEVTEGQPGLHTVSDTMTREVVDENEQKKNGLYGQEEELEATRHTMLRFQPTHQSLQQLIAQQSWKMRLHMHRFHDGLRSDVMMTSTCSNPGASSRTQHTVVPAQGL